MGTLMFLFVHQHLIADPSSGLIECNASQDYPHYKIEWIVVDDGTDVKDIFEDENTKTKLKDIKIHYFYEKKKWILERKEIMHSMYVQQTR